MIISQIRLPWRIVQAGGAVLKNQPSPSTLKSPHRFTVAGFFHVQKF